MYYKTKEILNKIEWKRVICQRDNKPTKGVFGK